jgi:hypothetical protein
MKTIQHQSKFLFRHALMRDIDKSLPAYTLRMTNKDSINLARAIDQHNNYHQILQDTCQLKVRQLLLLLLLLLLLSHLIFLITLLFFSGHLLITYLIRHNFLLLTVVIRTLSDK